MVTEGYHFFKPLRKAAVARPWAGRAAEATGTWRNRSPVEELPEPIGIDALERRLRVVEDAGPTKLEFWQAPVPRIRQKTERFKVVKTLWGRNSANQA
jgi:hypothetical protein